METWVIATSLIFGYLVLTLLLGLFANRRLTIDMEDFFLYGRKAGFVVMYLTVVATYHSAFAFLGTTPAFSQSFPSISPWKFQKATTVTPSEVSGAKACANKWRTEALSLRSDLANAAMIDQQWWRTPCKVSGVPDR